MKKLIRKLKQIIQAHPKFSKLVLFIIIFLISLAIRRIGLKFGFPLLTHPDEPDVILPVLRMTSQHTLNPGEFAHPDHILHYLNLIYLNLLSFILYGQNFAASYNEHYLDFYFYSRFLISVLGSLIPIVAYKIGEEIKPKLALPSALIFAFFPVFVKHSLFITPDVPITLFTLLVTYFTIRYLNSNKEKFIILATIFSAVNTAEKYPGLLSFAIILAAVGLQVLSNKEYSTPQKIRFFLVRSFKLGMIFIVSLFVVAPFLFLDYRSVIESLRFESRSYHLGSDNLGLLGNLWFYIQTFYQYTGFLGTLLFAVGLFSFITRFSKRNILVLYGFFYWIMLSIMALHWERWALPMYIAPLFIIAFGVDYLWCRTKESKFLFKLIGALILLVFIIQQSSYSIYIPVRRKFTDTRWVSLQYCQSVGITESNTIYEGNSPLRPSYSKRIFDEYTSDHADKAYLILSSFMYDSFFEEPERYAEEIRIYDEIRADNPLLAEFVAAPPATNTFERLENIFYFIKLRLGFMDQVRLSGPTIEIYELTD